MFRMLRRLFGYSPPPKSKKRHRLNGLELLESRLTPADLFWTGAVSNLMSFSGNYVGNPVVAAGSNIILDPRNAGGQFFETPLLDDQCPAFGTIDFLVRYRGIIGVDHDATVTQILTNDVGQHQGFNIENGSTLTATTVLMVGGKFEGGGILAVTPNGGLLDVAGVGPQLKCDGLTIGAMSTMRVRTDVGIAGMITNEGTLQWMFGNVHSVGTSELLNQGLIHVTGGDHVYSGPSSIRNFGNFRVALDTSKTLTLQGSLYEQGPGGAAPVKMSVETGSVVFAMNAVVRSEIAVSAAGSVLVRSQEFRVHGDNLHAAKFTGAGPITVMTDASLIGDAFNVVLLIEQRLILDGGSLVGSPGAIGDVDFSIGELTSIKGTIKNCYVDAGTTWIGVPPGTQETGLVLDDAALTFEGGTWESGDVELKDGSLLKNTSVWDLLASEKILNTGANNLVENAADGQMQFGGGVTVDIEPAFETSGHLFLNGSTAIFRATCIQSDGEVWVQGGRLEFFVAGGSYRLEGGELFAHGTLVDAALDVVGGTLVLSGIFTVTKGDVSVGATGGLVVAVQGATFGYLKLDNGDFKFAAGAVMDVYLVPGWPLPPAGTTKVFIKATGTADVPPAPAGWQTRLKPGTVNEVELIK